MALRLKRNGQAEVGMYTSTSSGYCGTGGRMPTTWCGRSFIWKTLPTTEGSPPKLRFQYLWLRSKTACAPGASSASCRLLPYTGWTPRTSKTFAETTAVETRSGSARPRRMNHILWKSTTPSRLFALRYAYALARDWRRQSPAGPRDALRAKAGAWEREQGNWKTGLRTISEPLASAGR